MLCPGGAFNLLLMELSCLGSGWGVAEAHPPFVSVPYCGGYRWHLSNGYAEH